MENIYTALYYFLWKVKDPFAETVTCTDSIFIFMRKIPMVGESEGLQI